MKKNLRLSIILPTYNNERTISKCLAGIFMQNHLKKNFEVLIIDGGSFDGTLEICKKYPVKILKNEWRVEERGRAIGIKAAKNEIVGFIDADNIILDKDFFRRMTRPFEDEEISAVDTLFYAYEEHDSPATKYCALLSGDDPYAIYLGLNDRLCFFNNKWTGMPHTTRDEGDYLRVKIFKNHVPAMGSNGFFVRKSIFANVRYDPFVHTDFVNRMIEKGYNVFGKAKIGIKHDLADFHDFFKKKLRRVRRRVKGEISLEYEYNVPKIKILFVSLLFLTWIVPLFDALRGFIRKRDKVWIMHPIICFAVLCIYIWGSLYYSKQ